MQERLTLVCLLLWVGLTPLFFVLEPGADGLRPLLWVNLPGVLVVALCYGLVRRGHRAASAVLFAMGLHVVGFVSVWVVGFEGGVHVVPLLAVAWVGVFGDTRLTAAMAGVGTLWLTGLAWVDPEPMKASDPMGAALAVVAAMVVLVTLIALAHKQARRAVAHAARAAAHAEAYEEGQLRAEAAYRAIVEGIDDCIVLLDLTGRVLHVNEATVRVTGRSLDELRDRPYLGLGILAPSEVPRSAAMFADLLAHGRIDPAEIVARHKDGHRVLLRVRARVLPLPELAGRGILCVMQDLTAEREARSEARRLSAELQQARRLEAIGRLAGGVAHDFNNLLLVMGHSVERMRDGDDPAELIDELDVAVDRATQLTRQLLAVGQRQVLRPRQVTWQEVVEGIGPILARLAGDRVSIEVEGLPGRVEADPSQLERVVINLVANGVDAIVGAGTVRLRSVPVEGDERLPEGAWVVLEVADTGEGIDADTLTRVFEPFFSTKGSRGTGLGLATVYGIVRQSGGVIDVVSEPGVGTTFRVALPPAP